MHHSCRVGAVPASNSEGCALPTPIAADLGPRKHALELCQVQGKSVVLNRGEAQAPARSVSQEFATG